MVEKHEHVISPQDLGHELSLPFPTPREGISRNYFK